MGKYIFMNHHLHEKSPKEPVIRCEEFGGRYQVDADQLDLYVDGRKIGHVKFNKKGLKAVKTPKVKAWVYLTDEVKVIAK